MTNSNIVGENFSVKQQQDYYNLLENAHDDFATIDLFGHPVQIQTQFVDSRGRRSNALPINVQSTPSNHQNVINTKVTAHAAQLQNGPTTPFVWGINPSVAFRRINKNQQEKQKHLSYLNYLI